MLRLTAGSAMSDTEFTCNFHTALTLRAKHASVHELAQWLTSTLGPQGKQWDMQHSKATTSNSFPGIGPLPVLVFVEFNKEKHKMLFDLCWEDRVKKHYVTTGVGPPPETMTTVRRYGTRGKPDDA